MRTGFTLVEVVVATLLLTLSTAGAVGLHVATQRSARRAQSAERRDLEATRRLETLSRETRCEAASGASDALRWAIAVDSTTRRLTFSDRPDTITLACLP
jgi:type II secretory pathway component PulJ